MSSPRRAPPEEALADHVYDFFQQPLVLLTMSTLLIIDITCVILGISFEIQSLSSEVEDYEDVVESCQHEILNSTSAGIAACDDSDMGKEFYDKAERFVFWVSIVILSTFLLESLIQFVAKPMKFFFDKGKMLDFVIVTVALVLEIVYEKSNVGGLIVLARVWRFARIGHGVHEESSKDCDSCQANGIMIHQLDTLNDGGAVIKAYEDMLAGGGPETVDTELMDSLLHIIGAHLKKKEEMEMELLEYDPPPVVKENNFSLAGRGGDGDVYTRM